jgi:energy-coupling factor transporter ATP-binding protein EcfA2
VTLYNPHLRARQDLIETFVARQPLLDQLIDDLRRGGGQHHLLVGGRGSGKTTLLLRLAAALEDDRQLAKQCIPLRFPEEQYNVSRPSDLWMNAIDSLVDARERQDDHSAARQLESSLFELEPLDEDERAGQSLAILEAWSRQSRQLIVLLIDNLDLVLDRLADSLWDLRETLSSHNGLVVVGASSKFIEEAIDYQSPFYDFFHVHELGPLSEQEARCVVLSLAQRANTPRVAEVLERDPGRFKALHVLTGGTPRTLALLHTVLALDHSDRIERDLEGLLDQLTPYYKARFDDLPSQSQVIVDKVALHWHPITAAECQAATHLDVNLVSAQLSRLVKNGLLTKVSLPGPGKLGFQLSERFFNIWYLMRASRRLRRRLSWFVEFLRIFYGDEDLRRRAEDLVRAAPPGNLDGPARLLAFATAVSDETLRRRLEFRAIDLLAKEQLATIREIMDLEGEDLHLAPAIDRVRALRDVRERIVTAKTQWAQGITSEFVAEAIAGHPILSIDLKRRIVHAIHVRGYIGVKTFLDTSTAAEILGTHLMNTIASGELPSIGDISINDIPRFIALAQNTDATIILIVFYHEKIGTPFNEAMIKSLLRYPETRSGLIAVANSLLADDWMRSRQFLLPMLRSADATSNLGMFMTFFLACIRKNRVSEAIDLLVETGLSERWAPVYEALRAFKADRSQLEKLAPEVRAPTLQLYDLFADTIHSIEQQQPMSAAPTISKQTTRNQRKPPRRRPAAPRRARPRRTS